MRFPDHTLSDTWMLEFADPDRPYSIRFRVSELGGAFGGELKPVPPLAGWHAAARRPALFAAAALDRAARDRHARREPFHV